MTKALLSKVAKAKRINLHEYDSVLAYVNDRYTKIRIIFGNAQVCGGEKRIYNRREITLNVWNILSRCEEDPEDYETAGWQYIYMLTK